MVKYMVELPEPLAVTINGIAHAQRLHPTHVIAETLRIHLSDAESQDSMAMAQHICRPPAEMRKAS